jgi:hypothetical protein
MVNWKPEGRKNNEVVPEEPGKMGYVQQWVERVSEWANRTIEGNGKWQSEGVARRFKTVQYIYVYIYIYICTSQTTVVCHGTFTSDHSEVNTVVTESKNKTGLTAGRFYWNVS